jgi:sirohydrochlorin cobaltochelatase
MTAQSAIILFAHGARDVRWAQPLDRLRAAIAIARPGVRTAIAFLELQPPGLPATLAELAAAGVTHIDIAPIFWSRGGHIARDLPALVQTFSAGSPGVQVRVLPVLAELPGMEAFVAGAITALADGATRPETGT